MLGAPWVYTVSAVLALLAAVLVVLVRPDPVGVVLGALLCCLTSVHLRLRRRALGQRRGPGPAP